MEYQDTKNLMLEQARNGDLGTHDHPIRGNSLRTKFWIGFFGYRHPREYPKGSVSKACVAAGLAWKKETE